MAFSDTPKIGVELGAIYKTAADKTRLGHRLGSQILGSDGKLYVFAQAGAAIPASTAVCTVNAGTFIATATGGAYTSPAVAMATGDQGWFSKASV